MFLGYESIGIDEAGLLIEMGESHGESKGKLRIVPLHAILAIDVLDVKEHGEHLEKGEPGGLASDQGRAPAKPGYHHYHE